MATGISLTAGETAAHGKTPQPLVDKLSTALVKVFALPELRETFQKLGSNLEGSSPEALGNILKTQMPAWREAIQFAKIPVE